MHMVYSYITSIKFAADSYCVSCLSLKSSKAALNAKCQGDSVLPLNSLENCEYQYVHVYICSHLISK